MSAMVVSIWPYCDTSSAMVASGDFPGSRWALADDIEDLVRSDLWDSVRSESRRWRKAWMMGSAPLDLVRWTVGEGADVSSWVW